MTPTAPTAALRIDRWLFYCRFYKTRVLASKAVSGGHVRVNGQRVVPGQKVHASDTIELTRDRLPYAMTVLSMPARRGPAREAQCCYADDEIVAARRAELSDELRRDRRQMATTTGRPDKHTQRLLRQRNRKQ